MLQSFDVRRCRNVTALSVVAFLEHAHRRNIDMIQLHVSFTAFDFNTVIFFFFFFRFLNLMIQNF